MAQLQHIQSHFLEYTSYTLILILLNDELSQFS